MEECSISPDSPLTAEQIRTSNEVEELMKTADPEVKAFLSGDFKKKRDDSDSQRYQKLKVKLLNLKSKIDEFKEKRRHALKIGKTSKARRMAKQIKIVEKKLNDQYCGADELQSSLQTEKTTTCESLIDKTSAERTCETVPIDMPLIDETPSAEVKGKMKRKDNYCLYCKKLVQRFCSHIETVHGDTSEGQALKAINSQDPKEKRKEKMNITDKLRKQWNAIYNQEVLDKMTHNIPQTEVHKKLITVKKIKTANPVTTLLCKFCKGQYRRDKLKVHLKKCNQDIGKGKIQAIKKYSSPLLPGFSYTDEFKKEILNGIHMDLVMETALNDPTIVLFGSNFHKSRRELQSKDYVIREMRDLAKLLMKMKEINEEISNLQECFSPKHFKVLVAAALDLAKYKPETGNVGTPSVAYRLSQPINLAADLVISQELEKVYRNGGDRTKVTEVYDFKEVMRRNWKTEIGRICSKSQKKARVIRPEIVALVDDIIKLAAYIEKNYKNLLSQLDENDDKTEVYNTLMHYLVTHIMLLIRRRPVDFKNSSLIHYDNLDCHDNLIEMARSLDEFKQFNEVDVKLCKRFHIFYVPGKNLEIVPMVLTPIMKRVLDNLIKYRESVGIRSQTLFVLSEEVAINPGYSLKVTKSKVKLKAPKHLTGNGLRHQAATFSKLHSKHPQYTDFLASMLGHTLATHKKHYDLPMGVLQKIMVCPIMERIMKGKTRNLQETQDQGEENNSELEEIQSFSDEDGAWEYLEDVEIEENTGMVDDQSRNSPGPSHQGRPNYEERSTHCTPIKTYKKRRWTKEEEDLVLSYFGKKILDRVKVSRKEVVEFMATNGKNLNRSIAQVVLFVDNHICRKQKEVTPKIKKILKKQ